MLVILAPPAAISQWLKTVITEMTVMNFGRCWLGRMKGARFCRMAQTWQQMGWEVLGSGYREAHACNVVLFMVLVEMEFVVGTGFAAACGAVHWP